MVSGISYALAREERGYGNGKDFLNVEHEVVERFSIRSNAISEIDAAIKDKNYRKTIVLSDTTPGIILSQKGTKNLPLQMNAAHVRQNILTAEQGRLLGINIKVEDEYHWHGLGDTLFKNIINNLENVNEAYRGTANADNPSRRENYFILISQFYDNNGNQVMAPVYVNESGQYNDVQIDVNKVSTIFGKQNLRDYLRKEIEKGNLVRIKNKSNQFGERTDLNSAGYEKDAYVDNLSQKQYSVKDSKYFNSHASYEARQNL